MKAVSTTVAGYGTLSPPPKKPIETGEVNNSAPAEFALSQGTLLCSQCSSLFATQLLSAVPGMTPDTAVEADFHRLLPDVVFRSALVAICPACGYAAWAQDFETHLLSPHLVPAALEYEPSIKYAHAVKSGRQYRCPTLNLALLALNGLWCARQEGKPAEPWLKLTIKSLSEALNDVSWTGNRPYYLYIRGEIHRQNADFEAGLQDFEQAVPQMKVPRELIERQKSLALAGNREPALLSPHLVEQIFCFDARTNPDWNRAD